MRFVDHDIRLFINNLSFKAYLEDSEHLFEPIDQPSPFVPTSWPNDSVAIRMLEKVKFNFNVFAENRRECVINYRSLVNLIGTLKPAFANDGDLWLPAKSNLTGYITVRFKGMPNRNSAKIHLTSFSYNINKELGYLEVPQQEINTTNFAKHFDTNMKLIPLAYSINIEGKIIQPFSDTVRKGTKGTTYGEVSFDTKVLVKYKNDQKLIAWLNNNIGTSPLDYDPNQYNKIKTLFRDIREYVNDYGELINRNKSKKFNDAVQQVKDLSPEERPQSDIDE